MPDSDPVTMIAALVAVFGVAMVIWLLIAAGLRESSPACLCLAGANALQAGAMLLLRVPEPDMRWLDLGADLMLLTAFGLTRLAVPLMAERPARWPPVLATVVLVAALLTQLPAGPTGYAHLIVLDGTLGILCLLAALDTYRLLRARELKRPLAVVFGGPFLLLGLLLLARPLGVMWAPAGGQEIDIHSSFNIAWLWAALVVALALNGTLAFLLVMKLVLQIRRLTLRDPLTDALNRRAMAEAMAREHHRVQRGHPYALVLLDMDRFKQLNDTLGHAAGDAALKALVDVLQPCLREVDLLGRLGGEEFCALLPYTSIAGAALVAERMRHLLARQAFAWNGQAWPLSASFGITEAVAGDEDPTEVLRRADEALYRAKAQGRNVVQAVEAVDAKKVAP
ncbi:diguanylate cyclase (GGDEF) domain-containing protein [Roseateles sp. YR242]|uniref:GGDEF domain-containing protein n=1 Tax=Roseateles sp. YR242 TaxID=1855305 RepID=UPI0008D67ECC|nr:GGDEF domain-containing protein [Roseateles sp. YR242]SEK83101.1 diguanylate cyclase (GGDEF) domain-containing protein [Roseateles sp. YR242]